MSAVQQLLMEPRPVAVGGDVATTLARALDRLMSATVDAKLADGEGLSVSEGGAREQALDALAKWADSRG
jgi:hypothetical protein